MPSTPRIAASRLGAVALCAIFAVSAFAADAPSSKPLAVKSKQSPLLTRDELRACMSSQAKLHQQRDDLDKQQSQLMTEKQELVRAGNELKEQLASLDRTNTEAVGKYVEANNSREKRIDEFERNSTSYNDKVQALETADATYKKDCANRRFDEKDELAIKKGK